MVAVHYRHHLTSTKVCFDPTQEAMLRRSEGPQSALGVHRHERPFADLGHEIKMLRCGPPNRTFAAIVKSARDELTDCGQSVLCGFDAHRPLCKPKRTSVRLSKRHAAVLGSPDAQATPSPRSIVLMDAMSASSIWNPARSMFCRIRSGFKLLGSTA